MHKQPLTKQDQQYLGQRMSQELEKMIMSWDKDLQQWHIYAMQGLYHASAAELQVPAARYKELLAVDKHGVNMNVVMVLANNLENRTPAELGYSVEHWAQVMDLNTQVSKRWMELQAPVQKKVEKEFEIMNNKPAMKIIPAEA